MADIEYDVNGNPINTAPSPVPPLGQNVPQPAPGPAPVYTPAAPMNPEDAELLQAPAVVPTPIPVPNAADTHQMVTNLTTNGTATDPTLNFKPVPNGGRIAPPNDLTALDAAKTVTDKTAEANLADVTEAAKTHADSEDKNARDVAVNSALEAQDRADFNQKWNDNHDKLEQHYHEIEGKYLQALDDNQHPKDFFTGKTTLQKFGAIFGMALGSLGGATPGGNAAVESMNRQMEVEHQRQKETIEGLDHATLRALTHISDDNAARQVANTDLTAQWTAMRQHMIDEGTARLKSLGQTEAQIAGNVALNDLKAKNASDKFNVHQEYSKNMSENLLKHAQAAAAYGSAEESGAKAQAFRNGAMVGPLGEPVPGSKTDKAIMSQYVLPHKAEGNDARTRITLLGQSMKELDDPNLTFGGAKQALINGFQASGGNPKGRIAVADIKEVMPEMQSIPDELITHILQGGTGKVSDAYRKTVKNVIAPKLDYWKSDYKQKADDLEKNIPAGTPEAKKFYRKQVYADLPEATAPAVATPNYPVGTKAKDKATGKSVTWNGTQWE